MIEMRQCELILDDENSIRRHLCATLCAQGVNVYCKTQS
jgi:hypothetical protein